MTTIEPKAAKLKQAIKWISEKRKEDENSPVTLLIEQAAYLFNLSPKEEDFLRDLL